MGRPVIDIKQLAGTRYYQDIKRDLRADAAPTVTTDASKGFSVGSVVIYGNQVFYCTDATINAAVWVDVTDTSGGAGAVTSVFGRSGVVTAASGDYDASEITNDSGVSGVTVADALDTLEAAGGGSSFTTLAELNAIVTDATLDDASDPRDPNAHTHDDSEITAAGSATNYTPSGATVEGHLAGIDTALGGVGGGGLANGYATIQGDSGTAYATGADTLALNSADNKMSITAADGSPDTVTFTVNEANLSIDINQVDNRGALSERSTVGTAEIEADAVVNAQLAEVAEATIKGRADGAGTGNPQDLTAAQVRTILNVEDGANNYAHPDHTGDVTSTGDGATVLDPSAITGKTEKGSTSIGDYFLVSDGAAAGALKKVDAANLPGAGGGISNAYTSIQCDSGTCSATGAALLKIEGADGKVNVVATDDGVNPDKITIDLNLSQIQHDSLAGFVLYEHIDWTQTHGSYIHDDNISESSVTQHQAALSITESQISDLQSYLLAADINTLAELNTILTDATLDDSGASRPPTAHGHDDAEITAAGTATNYTPGSATVDGHLSGIDSALGSISGVGDMTKAVYDTGDNGRVDNAEQLNDGTNTVTASQARTHIDDAAKHREINDAGSTTTDLWSASKITTELSGKSDTGHTHTASDITDFDTEVSNNASVVANTAKVTNATHTGDATGDGALTLQPAAITGKTAKASPVGTDTVLIADSEDSWNLKEAALSSLPGGGTPAHNDTTGKQGGTTAEYYHLTATQHTDLTDSGDSTLHYHAADRDRTNHSGTQTASTISDFDTEVSNNTDVAANTSARHTQSHAMTSTSDHSAGNWKTFHSNGSGEVVELALGADGDVLTSNGTSAAPSFKTVPRYVEVEVFADGETWSTGDGKATFVWPSWLSGLSIDSVEAASRSDTTSLTTIQIQNETAAVDMLSTELTIDDGERSTTTADTAAVINATYDTPSTHDVLSFDVDGGSGSGNLWVLLRTT